MWEWWAAYYHKATSLGITFKDDTILPEESKALLKKYSQV